MVNACTFFFVTFFPLFLFSQENAKDEMIIKKQLLFSTKHKIDINGKPLHFTAIADEIFLKNDDNKIIASVFSFSYKKEKKVMKLDQLFLYLMVVQDHHPSGCI